jgi:hypothetical protein
LLIVQDLQAVIEKEQDAAATRATEFTHIEFGRKAELIQSEEMGKNEACLLCF